MTAFPAKLLVNTHDVDGFTGVASVGDFVSALLSPGTLSGTLTDLGAGADGVDAEDLPFAAYTFTLKFKITGDSRGEAIANLFTFITTIRPESSVCTLERQLSNATNDGYNSWTAPGVIEGYATKWENPQICFLDLSITNTTGRWSSDGGTTWSVL